MVVNAAIDVISRNLTYTLKTSDVMKQKGKRRPDRSRDTVNYWRVAEGNTRTAEERAQSWAVLCC